MLRKPIVLIAVFAAVTISASAQTSVVTSFLESEFGLRFEHSRALPSHESGTRHEMHYDLASAASNDGSLHITNAAIVSLRFGNPVGTILISPVGLVTSWFGPLYDFSEPGYGHIPFSGWVFELHQPSTWTFDRPAFYLHLATDTGVPTTDSMPPTIYESPFGYPVVRNFPTNPGIVASWRENRIIALARLGLPEDHTQPPLQLSLGWIAELNSSQRRLLRNAMFAVHGYTFSSSDLTTYFAGFPWYTSDPAVSGGVETLLPDQRRLLEYLDRLPPPVDPVRDTTGK